MKVVLGRWIAAVLAAGSVLACDEGPSALDPERRVGSLDVSRVVAVGDGFAAGAMDDALYASGQESSVPALFMERALGRSDFVQPLVADPGFGLRDPAGGRLILESVFPPELGRLPLGGPSLEAGLARPFDNLGVPFALVEELRTARSSATSILGNPFFDVVLRDRGTVVEQVAELDATLVLLWGGAANILVFAANGGDPALAPGLPTPVGTFALAYGALVDGLLATTDQVVLFTLPDVGALPLVAAVPPHVIDPITGEPVTITVLEPVFDPITGEPVFDPETGDTLRVRREKPLPLIGPEGPLAENDRVTIFALELLAEGTGIPESEGGTGQPLPDRVVLDASELAEITAAVAGYNAVITEVAEARDLAMVDVAALVAELLATGIVTDGVRVTSAWPAGQAFSLDGAHFTAKGYGLVANRLIDALNARYDSTLLHIRTFDLPGVPLFSLSGR